MDTVYEPSPMDFFDIEDGVLLKTWDEDFTTLVIPDCVVEIGEEALRGWTGLTTVVIPDSVTKIGDHAFEDCIDLTTVVIGDSVEIIGMDAFLGCHALTSVTLGKSVCHIDFHAFEDVPWYEKICEEFTEEFNLVGDGYLLKYCGKGGDVTVPPEVKHIGSSSFKGVPLNSLTISQGTLEIWSFAFSNRKDLTSVVIPDSLEGISTRAFHQCVNLTTATVGAGSLGETYMKEFCPQVTLVYA